MATYEKEKGSTVQTLSTDPVGSRALGGSWASATSLNVGRAQGMGFGTYTAAFYIGGDSPAGAPVRDLTESYNGSSWTETTDINTGRRSGQGFGTTTAGVIAAGYDFATPNPQFTETWNGSAWSESGDLTRSGGFQSMGVSATSSTAAVVYGGQPGTTYFKYSETWNGSSWSEGSDLNTGRVGPFGAGTATAGICMSGGPLPITAVETYDGSSWTTISATVNSPRNEAGNVNGTQTDCIISGGYDGTSPGSVAKTEIFDGTSFSEAGDLATARYNFGRTYSPTMGALNSIAVAGGPPTALAIMEEWTAPTTFTKQVDGQLFFNSTTNAFKITEKNVPGGAWASGGALNTARAYVGPATRGTQDAALGFGGDPNGSDLVESYNGTSWSEVAEINTPRAAAAGAGTQTSALASTGFPSTGKDKVESWNGSSWTEVAEPNLPRDSTNGTGASNTSAIIFGGYNPPQIYEAETEVWDGTSWTEVSDLNTARRSGGSAGIATSAMLAGGSIQPGVLDNVETWNGTSWTEVAEMNAANSQAGCGSDGTNTNVLRFGGEKSGSPNTTATTELWNGSSWTELGDLATARYTPGGAGSTSSAIAFGGYTNPPAADSALTEEWTAPLANFTITSS